MERKNKITLFAIILPIIYLLIITIITFIFIFPNLLGTKLFVESVVPLILLSFLVFVSIFPLAISLLIGIKILDTKHPKLIFLVTPILTILLSVILTIIFIVLLNVEWYIGECCSAAECDFGGPKFFNVFIVGGAIILNILNIVVSLILSGIFYKINKKIKQSPLQSTF